MGRVKKSLPRPRTKSSGSNSRSSSLEMDLTRFSLSDHVSLEPRHVARFEDSFLEWSIRRVQYAYLTVKFGSSIPIEVEVDTAHDCLFCSCRCKGPAVSEAFREILSPVCTFSGSCRHCLYYPESHPGRCIGKLRERSGSLAYILRNPLTKEMPIASTADGEALEILRRMPLGFELIEKVRQRYQTYPLGYEPKYDRSFFARDFIASVGLNRYDGYQSMLTNASSMVKPMSRETWNLWYHTQIHQNLWYYEQTSPMTPPFDWSREMLLPEPFLASRARFLYHIVLETDPSTGSTFYTQSPRIYVGDDDKCVRLELTSSPPEDSCRSIGSCQPGAFRTVRRFTSEGVFTGPEDLEEDTIAGGYPIATLERAPLKQFYPSQDRELRCILEYDRGVIISDVIRLADDHRYLKIFLTSN